MIRRRLSGAELIGSRYRPPFEIVPVDDTDREAGWRVIPGDFVSAEEGTGIGLPPLKSIVEGLLATRACFVP